MPIGVIGKKLGMTQVLKENGEAVPVTVIELGPCTVIQKKTKETDQYNALQLGFTDKKEKKTNKPQMGHFKKSGISPKKVLKEIRLEASEIEKYEVGQEIKADIFEEGEHVDVTATTKGRGFAGVMKRHGFHGAPASHGTGDYKRHGGSIGSGSWPSKVFKGMKMPGRMGGKQVTVQNLKIENIRSDQNLLLVKGAVPGAVNGTVIVKKAIKKCA